MQLNGHQSTTMPIMTEQFKRQSFNQMYEQQLTRQEAAIKEFFEGYGIETLKEYGQTMFDLLAILQSHKVLSEKFQQDVTTKFNSLFKLISNLVPFRQEAAIKEFFEGYGSETLKEYGQTMFDLLSLLKSHKVLSEKFEEDVTNKFHSVYRLISNLEMIPHSR